MFLIATQDSKATLYNDKSVLENHHVASSFLVMNDPENNFLGALSKSDFKVFRDTVIDVVLATGTIYFMFRFDSTFHAFINVQI